MMPAIQSRHGLQAEGHMNRAACFLLAIMFSVSGCAVTGPKVSPWEVAVARQELEEEALRTSWLYQKRLFAVSDRTAWRVKVPGAKYRNTFGLFVAVHKDITADQQKFLKALGNPATGAVLHVQAGSPGHAAGLKEGDLLLAIADRPLADINADELKGLGVDATPKRFLIRKKGKDVPETITLRPAEVLDVDFRVAPVHQINAAAGSRGGRDTVIVTYGMINFALNADELAVTLGHEMVHLLKGHIQREGAIGALGALLALGIGIAGAVSGVNPGPAMQGVMDLTRGTQTAFSREYEREADYLGLYLAHQGSFDVEMGTSVWKQFASENPQTLASSYLSTHPSSAERFVRVKKTIEEIRKGRTLVEAWSGGSEQAVVVVENTQRTAGPQASLPSGTGPVLSPKSESVTIAPLHQKTAPAEITPQPAPEFRRQAKKVQERQVTAISKPASPEVTAHTNRAGAKVFAQQWDYSKVLTTLEQGEALILLGKAFGTGDAQYKVRTQKGVIGWVSSADVIVKP